MSVKNIVMSAAGASAPSDPNFKNVSLLISGDGTNGAQNNTFVDNSGNAVASAAIKYAKIYSTYNGGTRGANYTVQYSDDGSNWNTAWTGTMTSSACGLITGTGGGGSYGTHKYWRYVVGSSTNSHHPRCSRIVLSTDTVDYDIYVYTTDNCADSGGIPGQDSVFSYTFGITRNGNTTQGTFSPYGNLWSNYFDGSGDSLTFSGGVTNVGTGDFCLELWTYFTGSYGTYTTIWDSRTTAGGYTDGFSLNLDASGNWVLGFTVLDLNTSTPIAQNQWQHVCATRQSGTIRLFVNGVLAGTLSSSNNLTSTTNRVGQNWNNTYYYTGYISNVRAIKSSVPAQYQTSSTTVGSTIFTPPTTPLTAVSGTSLLTCQSNRFIDNSSNNFTLTVNGNTSVQRFSPFNPTAPYSASTIGGSGYFDGSGDYLSIPYSTNYCSFGTGDFTIECFVYEITHVNYTAFISSAGSGVAGWFFGYSNSQKLCFYADGTFYLECDLQKLNRWSHVAVTRQSGTLRMYIDGVLQGSTTYSSSIPSDSTHAAVVGKRWTDTAEYFWNGYITDIRILKGTALYTGSTYTVPTAPLTAITNTQLLTSFTNAGIPDAAMMNDLETVGNAQVFTSANKYGTGSINCTTGSNYLRHNSQSVAFGTGDFTVECWVYPSTVQSVGLFQSNESGLGTNGITICTDNSRGILVYSSGYAISGYGGNVTANQWNHVAVTRSNGTLRVFIAGTQTGSASFTSDLTSTAFNIGTANGVASSGTQMYIDDFRITKGYARYTASFTPPALSLPNY